MFSTSPRIFEPSSTSNSVTAPEPSFVTWKVVGPLDADSEFGSQPLSVSDTSIVGAFEFDDVDDESSPPHAANTKVATVPTVTSNGKRGTTEEDSFVKGGRRQAAIADFWVSAFGVVRRGQAT